MQQKYRDLIIRDWQPIDRDAAATVIGNVLAEYGLGWEPTGADIDVLEVEKFYLDRGGEFWVVTQAGIIVGTAGYYPCNRADLAVEIRKMYLMPSIRGQGLGKYLLHQLESAIRARGHRQIWIETASILTEAVALYTSQGYQPAAGVETARCDLVYQKVIDN
jgi:putative acetyltransferase